VKRTMAGTSVAVVLFGAPAALVAATAGRAAADQITTTRAQISAIESEVSRGAGAIHALTVAYDQANLEADALGRQVVADQQQLAKLQQQVAVAEKALRREAILSYTGGVDTTTVMSPGADPAVRATYLSIATGSISDNVDRYRTEQYQLNAATVNLEHQEQASEAAALEVAASRATALAQAAAEESQLNSLQGRLNQLLVAQTQGMPVNNGLVAVVHAIVSPGGGAGGVWLQLRECESGDNYQANTGNGFYGAYQFSQSTWTNLGYPGRPDLEPPAMQDAAAQKLQAESGWGQWPACSAALGLH
jgi:hypothetical protein